MRVDPTGFDGPTKRQASTGRWRRTGHGLYVPSDVEPSTPEQRAVEALTARSEPAVLTGWAALWVHGATYFDGVRRDGRPRPVQVAVGPGPGRRVRPGTRLSYEKLLADEVVLVDGLAVTTPRRALFDELRCPPCGREHVVAADMAVAAGLGAVAEHDEYARARSTWRRASWARAALEHASARSRSPQETRLRLLWTIDARLPEPLVNQPVFDLRGSLVCVADLFDADAGLVVEFDGSEHRRAARHARDVARVERAREVGLEVTTVTGLDMARPRMVVDRLRAARRRSAFLPVDARRWTLLDPPGWVTPWGLPPQGR